MNYFKGKNKEFSFRDLIYKALIFIGTVGVIVYFLPRDGKFNYQFDIDKPWKYGQLMATFDFPIYKDDQVVKKEQDSILASFQPYFQLDKSTGKEALKKLKNDYQTHLRDILPSSDYIRHIEKILSEVYRAGILSTEELARLHKDSTSAVMVIDDKLANQRSIDKLYSVKQAYAYLLTADTVHYRPNILFPTLFPIGQEHRERGAQETEERLSDSSARHSALFRLHPPYRKNTIRGVPGRHPFH